MTFRNRNSIPRRIFLNSKRRPDLGISLCDTHNDGSGTVFSSLKRPVHNFRPGYTMWTLEGTRERPADPWFLGFLERELGAEGYKVITDHDISLYGAPLLERYKVLRLGSHPEYRLTACSMLMLPFSRAVVTSCISAAMGYYWVTAHEPTRPHRIEVRRANQGCRTFGLPPGN